MAADESYPENLRYHREHDWARVDGDTAVVGITWYAQDALGELVHFEPPAEGASVAADLISPLTGEVIEVNQMVLEEPEKVNDDPYGDGWLIKIRLSDPGEADGLLDVAAYKALLEEQ